MQFIILGYDATDPDALSRRMAAREAHIASCDKLRDDGKLLYGVAMLNDQGKMCGSVMIAQFDSRAELDQWLKEEPYVTGKVWERCEVLLGKVGPSFEKLRAM